jgi:hypothetical protein
VARRKPSQLTTGRLQSLRLFSTLLALVLIDATKEPEPEVVVAIACSQSGYFEEHR